MRAGLVHDALYYLLRRGMPEYYRPIADDLLYKLMLEDGAGKIRARLYKIAVVLFGKNSANPKNKRKILVAP